MYLLVGFLIAVLVCLSFLLRSFAPLRNPPRGTLQDRSPQTETRQEPSESAPSIPAGDEADSGDSPEAPVQDVQYPAVKTSLEQVFACAYSQFLSSAEVPGPMREQPLYKALWRELDLATDRIIETVSDLDITATSTDCIHILTQHFHHMKEARRELLFSSWENEVAFLRVCSEALVQNFLPESTWKPELYSCVLKEIVAFKVLLQLVTWLSDPDTLNQLVERYLGVTSPCSPMVELCQPEEETAATGQPEDDEGTKDSTGAPENRDDKAKGKGKRIKQSLGKMLKRAFGKILKQTKKHKGKDKDAETGPGFRALGLQQLSDEEDDDSLSSSISEDSHLTIDEEMVNLLNEMWRDGRWTVTVPQVEERNKELVFTIHLEEQNSPEGLQNNVRMSEKQLQALASHLQDSSQLLSLLDLLGSTDRILDDEFKEDARARVEHFLQALISSKVAHSQEVFHLLFDPLCSTLCELLDQLPFIFSSTPDDDEASQGIARTETQEDPPTESTDTYEDFAKKVPNMDPLISRSDASSGSASSLDQIEKWGTGEPAGPGKDQPPEPANRSTDQPPEPANRSTDQPPEPANRSTDQPPERPANRSTDQPPVWPANWSTDQPPEWPANRGTDQPPEPANRSTDQPPERPANRSTDQPPEQPANRSTDQPPERPVNRGTDQPPERPANRGTDQTPERPANRGTDKPTDRPANRGTDKPTDQPANRSTDQPTDQLASQSTDQFGNQGTVQISYQGIEQSANQDIHLPTDQFAKQGTDQPTNQPADGGRDQRRKQQAVGPKPLLCTLSQDEGGEAKDQGPGREEKAASQCIGVDRLMKALMDLLTEIFSNSWTLRAGLKILRPLVLKKLTGFLDGLKLTDAQMASYLDSLREALWPKGEPAVWGPQRTSEEKSKSMQNARSLLADKTLWIFKGNVKSAFEALQDTPENKKLVYKLLSVLLMELFPGNRELHSKAGELLKSPLCVE